MNYQRIKMGLIAAALAVTAACADNGPAAPTAPTNTISASLIGKSSKIKADTTVTQFTIDPRSATRFDVGSKHELYIPARAVCDPAKSSYGIGTWDQPCVALSKPIVITAKTWIGADKLPKIEFEPALRFTTNRYGNDVTLFMDVASKKEADRGLTILYCPHSTGVCFDEALFDASLATHYDEGKGQVYRRIKHFSVYNVSSGRSDDGSPTAY